MGVVRAALIKDNRVANVILVDPEQNDYAPPEGFELVLISDDCRVGIGDVYDGSTFHPYTETLPPQDPPVSQELADAYEAIAALYEETEALKARVAVLEGGAA